MLPTKSEPGANYLNLDSNLHAIPVGSHWLIYRHRSLKNTHITGFLLLQAIAHVRLITRRRFVLFVVSRLLLENLASRELIPGKAFWVISGEFYVMDVLNHYTGKLNFQMLVGFTKFLNKVLSHFQFFHDVKEKLFVLPFERLQMTFKSSIVFVASI